MLLLLLPFVPLVVICYCFRRCFCCCGKNDYTGRHVMITGGSSGIGLALAKLFVRRGANVTIVARNKEKLIAAKSELNECQTKSEQAVYAVSVDLSQGVEAINAAVAQPISEIGQVDVLINNAGTASCGRFLDVDEKDFLRQMEINYLSSVYTTRSILPSMMQRRQGQVAFVSSMAGQVGLYGYSAYTPSKYALRGLAECVQMEVKPRNIKVSVVFPPDTDTPGFANENIAKPEATKRLSGSAGLFTSEQVAENIFTGLERNRYNIWVGLDGFFLSTLTCGMGPSKSFFESFPQVMLGGFLRFVALCYVSMFNSTVYQCEREENRL
ncbi:3-ketodihydrosphingosine reductase-like isoform X2 [Sycon ciliatum]|uniref:3-ketodihydrosphingosine reductase-like isoform X2 n=1 Tax=Sycon ciliatum TaxID=27933 RepID=UPI0031F63CDD